jgi:hypothetical protein
LIDIPFQKGKTREEEEHIFNCVKVNELRKARAKIYASITRGEKTLMKMVQSTDSGDWEVFHNKLKGSFDILTGIMDNLQMIGFDKAKGEDEKYLGYTSRLKKMIAKIDHIRATQAANLPGMITTLINQYVKEEEDFCESLIDPSTGEDWLDDQTRKDAADQQAQAADHNARLLRYKTLSANTSSKPSLTKRPDPSRTQGASAQAGSQQGAYAQAGAQKSTTTTFSKSSSTTPTGATSSTKLSTTKLWRTSCGWISDESSTQLSWNSKSQSKCIRRGSFGVSDFQTHISRCVRRQVSASKTHGVTATDESERQTSRHHL